MMAALKPALVRLTKEFQELTKEPCAPPARAANALSVCASSSLEHAELVCGPCVRGPCASLSKEGSLL